MKSRTGTKAVKYAAFIMTYERPEIVLKTIEILRSQNLPPEYLLVIDNSLSHDTEELLKPMRSINVGYYRVGENSGPAGAARIGLQKLSEMGFQWVFWGDDDNPPRDRNMLGHLISKIQTLNEAGINIGIYGGKGGKFNPVTGRLRTLANKELKSPYIEVDSVPGGHSMLVNTAVVKDGILPNEKLFFGFEELDFCLRVKKNGYRIFADSESWLKQRYKSGNLADSYRWKGTSLGKPEMLWRGFYSTRNLLEIFFKNGYYTAFLLLLAKSILKMVIGFRYGFRYGCSLFIIQFVALKAFFTQDFSRKKNPSPPVLPKI